MMAREQKQAREEEHLQFKAKLDDTKQEDKKLHTVTERTAELPELVIQIMMDPTWIGPDFRYSLLKQSTKAL